MSGSVELLGFIETRICLEGFSVLREYKGVEKLDHPC